MAIGLLDVFQPIDCRVQGRRTGFGHKLLFRLEMTIETALQSDRRRTSTPRVDLGAPGALTAVTDIREQFRQHVRVLLNGVAELESAELDRALPEPAELALRGWLWGAWNRVGSAIAGSDSKRAFMMSSPVSPRNSCVRP